MGLKICAIIAGIKKYKSIIQKKKKKHEKIILLVKSKLNITEVLISKALINLALIQDELVLIKKCAWRIWRNERRNKKFKHSIKLIENFSLFIKQCYHIVWSVEKI